MRIIVLYFSLKNVNVNVKRDEVCVFDEDKSSKVATFNLIGCNLVPTTTHGLHWVPSDGLHLRLKVGGLVHHIHYSSCYVIS